MAVKLTPLYGINTAQEDAALQRGGKEPRLYVREAVNVDITPAGKASLRPQMQRVTTNLFRNLWQSPLHKDTFGTLGDQWVKVNPDTWTNESLAMLGLGDVSHDVVNNMVYVAGPAGIFTFNGAVVERLTLDTPSPPLVISTTGSLTAGTYGIAVAWLRGALESALSTMANVDVDVNAGLEITFPTCLDSSVTGVRLYLTKPNGTELAVAGDYSLNDPTIVIRLLPKLGRVSQFRYFSPMPTGKYLKYWRGRLLTAKANVLRFSEPLAYHIHDERHGFVQMPQRITFVQPVDGGIWVGQVDHVVFLQGSQPNDLTLIRKTSKPPIANSAILLDADLLNGDITQGGGATALWLAGNGYVLGTATGQLIEVQSGIMSDITARSATSVVLDRRLITAVL